MESSTINSLLESTQHPFSARRQRILDEWGARGKPDMVATLRDHPELLQQQSLLLELAIDEYEAFYSSDDMDMAKHCARFNEFGSSLCRSIQCQLEVHRYVLRERLDIAWPRAEDNFANFTILEQLGAGASSRVYLALEHAAGNRRVVLKVSPSTHFEASILGRLNHSNITPLYSNGYVEECNLYYLCMPFLARSTLVDVIEIAFRRGLPRNDRAIRQGSTRWQIEPRSDESSERRHFRIEFRTYVDGIVAIALQIAEGLIAAHGNGILHCDLKPSNILLTPELRPLIADFNLSQDLTSAKVSWGGTIPYMPPEHLELLAAGKHEPAPNTFTAASDIYSYGALVYELLTGVTPIGSDELSSSPAKAAVEVLERLRRGIQDPRDLNPLIGKRLSHHIRRCLAFDAIDRFATTQDVHRALKAESRSLASLTRKIRVRPFLFTALCGAPAVLLIAGVLYAAMRPPSFEREYAVGMKLVSTNNPAAAIDKFNAAVTANPSFSDARFELARARLANGQPRLAMNDFAILAKDENHLPSLAYLAYCFNLDNANTAAIPLWEEVKVRGFRSLAVLNNLAASYLDGFSGHNLKERLNLAETELTTAHAIDPSSLSVNLNLTRLAIKKSSVDSNFDPFTAWEAAQAALNAPVVDQSAKLRVALWWLKVRQFRHEHNILRVDPHIKNPDLKSAESKTVEANFQALFDSFHPTLGEEGQLPPSFQQLLRGNELYLEPR